MKKHLFLFLFATVASIGTLSAWDYENVQIGDLYYHLNSQENVATVAPSSYDWRGAYYDNYSELTTASIPTSVTYNASIFRVISIEEFAFQYCKSLTSVTIPNSVTSIGGSAFSGCSGLTSVTIPNSVTSIGIRAFENCKSLVSVTIPSSVTHIGHSASYGCSSLASIIVEQGNVTYDSRNNCNAIIETATNILLAGCKNSVIPNNVTSIDYNAFYYCSGLTSVTIPNSVTNIGRNAFDSCKGLKNVVLGTSLKTIDNSAFYNCPIDTITCFSNRPPTVGEDAFSMPYSTIVFVPADYLTYYQMHDFWGLYDVRPIEENAGGETVSVTVNYQDKNSAALCNEALTFHFPEVPEVEGFTFLGWQPVAAVINGSMTIQAVYKSMDSSYSPASVSVSGNPTQKLIRKGNVYILRGEKTYTVQGQEVK
jgi:hypothetical protein